MFNLFRGMGQLASLAKSLPRLREEMDRFQQRLGHLVAEGDAGAGMVKVRVNGRMEVLGCQLSEDALRLQDRELLEDLIKAATNQALDRVRQQVGEETSKVASGLGLSPGTDLPGLS